MTGQFTAAFGFRIALGLATLIAGSGLVQAQLIRAPLDRGFVRSSSIAVTVDEMLGPKKQRAAEEPILGPGYPALWIAEVQFKPVRYVRMPVTDPATGETSQELVWYMVYRVIPRDYSELAGDKKDELVRKLNDPTQDPVNPADPLQADPLLIPRFVLQTTDADAEEMYVDEVNLQIQQSVLKREFRKQTEQFALANSIQAVQPVPEPVSIQDPNPLENALYGVAVWRNVNPETDFFTVYMTGFSNAYRISTDENGQQLVEQKAIVQKFGRPGDQFLQDEAEFRVLGEPEWIYRERPAELTVPELDSILRNAPIQAADSSGPADVE